MADTHNSAPLLSTLLASDLVGSTELTSRLGDEQAAEVFQRHDRVARDLLSQFQGQEIDKTDGFLLLFDRPINAVRYALAYHDQLAALGDTLQVPLQARIGIHVGEVIRRANLPDDIARGAKPIEIEGIAKPMVARIMSVASGRQTLLTRVAFDLARRGTPSTAAVGTDLTWMAHGSYAFRGVDDAVEVYEVGREGFAPLAPPADADKVQRIIDFDTITGWRPAPGIEVPHRPNWILEEKVGVGGFGDVWRAEHKKTREKRAYKFCYDAGHLTGLKREVTLVRLLKEELGDRRDIVRILDWNFDRAPYFLEAEWSAAGSLDQWSRVRGGLATVPMSVRLEIVAQIAEALAAAHSVGVLHKDIKASNILMTEGVGDQPPQAQLADFGIGLVTDRTRLEQAGITQIGFTEDDAAIAMGSDGTATAGTRLYMAPELMEGKPSTIHADVYSLGVVLYQLVVGDLTRALGPGWERDVADPLVRDDIAAAVDRNPEHRIDVRTLADRLRRIETRRAELLREEQARAKALRNRRRIRLAGFAGAGLALVALATGVQLRRVSLESQRANREAETSRRVTEFLVDLFRVADPGETQGNRVTAREILDAGAARIRKGLEDQPDVQAALMGSMGQVYLGLGLPDIATPILEQSLAVRERVNGKTSIEVADALRLLGLARSDAGDLEAAEQYMTQALQLGVAHLGPDAPRVADILQTLGRIRWLKGDYAGGDTVGARAIAIYRQHGIQGAALGQALLTQSSVLFYFNRMAEADTLLREALTMLTDAYGPDDRRVADAMNNLGHVLTSEGRYLEARPLVESALSIYRRLLGPEHQSVGVGSTALGLLLLEQGDPVRAEELLRDALVIFEQRFGIENLFTVGAMTNLAGALSNQGKCDEAEPLARRGMDTGSRIDRPEWAIAALRGVIGECLVIRGRYAEAEPILREGYDIIATSVGGLAATVSLRRLVLLYERSGQPAKAAEYQALLAQHLPS